MSAPTVRSVLLILVAAVAVAAVILFFRSAGLQPPQEAFWDIVIKGAVFVTVAVGAAVTVTKHFAERVQANRAALTEARKPFRDKQEQVYFRILETTSILGNIHDDADPRWQAASSDFWQVYWGLAPLVIDGPVVSALDKYAEALHDRPGDRLTLRNLSMDLARACRSSLGYDEAAKLKGLFPGQAASS